jgi:hypothetical protein
MTHFYDKQTMTASFIRGIGICVDIADAGFSGLPFAVTKQ